MAPAPPALGAVVVHAANSTDMKLQLDGRTFASTSTSTLLTLSPSSFGTCNHVLWVSQAGTPFHMFSREALPLGNFPTRYSGARCPSPTPQIPLQSDFQRTFINMKPEQKSSEIVIGWRGNMHSDYVI